MIPTRALVLPTGWLGYFQRLLTLSANQATPCFKLVTRHERPFLRGDPKPPLPNGSFSHLLKSVHDYITPRKERLIHEQKIKTKKNWLEFEEDTLEGLVSGRNPEPSHMSP